MRRAHVVVGLALGVALRCGAATIHVPGDVPTIQAAIDQASDGDTVLVAPGVYLETIDLLGKQITLRGEQGAEQTIIDGHGDAPVVRISTGPGTQPVIEGFTITGGRPQQIGLSGAGILSLAMSPVIRDCIIEDNVADGIGGGVVLLGGEGPPAETPRLERCVIRGNSLPTTIGWGGGLAIFGGPIVAEIVDCVIENNVAATGSGVLIGSHTQVRFVRCLVRGNRVTAEQGAAVLLDPLTSGSAVVRFVDSAIADNGPLDPGQTFRSIVVNGSGMLLSLDRVTVAETTANGLAAIRVGAFARIELSSTALVRTGGNPGDVMLWLADNAEGTVRYSFISGGRDGVRARDGDLTWGPGNRAGDALLADPAGGDYTPLPGSPLVDAADPDIAVAPDATDLAGQIRRLYCRVDIGALESRSFADCNANGLPDACEALDGMATDCNGNLVPDTCVELEVDCNANDIPDACDLADGRSADVNGNGIPDECEPDCNHNGIPDAYEIDTGLAPDCNHNGLPDECDIASGAASDCNQNGMPDSCDILRGVSADCNHNGVPDECDVASGSASDCNGNGIPDSCDARNGSDCNGNGIPDACDPDCNGNGVPDDCDVADGTSPDCDHNGQPDECQSDCNGDGVIDACALSPPPVFEPRVMPLAGEPRAVGLADLDGDGAVDLAVGRQGPPHALDLLFGDGQGGFAGQRSLDVVRPPRRLVVADLDLDSDADVVLLTTESGVSVLWVMQNGGQRSFEAVQSLLFSPKLADVTVADVNGDSLPDAIVTFSTGSNPIVILPGQGGGTFVPLGSRLATGDDWRRVRAADVDGDGDRDLIVGGTMLGIGILLNDGEGDFVAGPRLLDEGTWRFAPVDFDGDGFVDLVAVSSAGEVGLWLGDREGNLVRVQSLSGPGEVRGLAVTDVTDDGLADLLYVRGTSARAAELVVMLGLGPETLSEAFTFDLGQQPVDLAAGDLDSDGVDDLVIGARDSSDATVMMSRPVPADSDCNADRVPDSCQIADGTLHDLDGDGVPDECACPVDLNQDRQIDVADVSIVVSNLGVTSGATFADGDLDGDGDVDLGDLSRLLPFVGLVCTP